MKWIYHMFLIPHCVPYNVGGREMKKSKPENKICIEFFDNKNSTLSTLFFVVHYISSVINKRFTEDPRYNDSIC